MEAAGALPVSRGSEDAERLPSQVLEAQAPSQVLEAQAGK